MKERQKASGLYLFHKPFYILCRGVHKKTFDRVEISFNKVGERRGKESHEVITPSNYFFLQYLGKVNETVLEKY